MGNLILAGDIGGTKTKLALYERHGETLSLLRENTYPSTSYEGIEVIVMNFIAGMPVLPDAACFGVAGPVVEGRCQTTNLPWLIEETAVAAQTGIPLVRLLNDLQAMALGLARLPADELVELNPDAQRGIGNIAVLAAGTGLGEALLHWDGKTHHAIATEGGHADFASNSREQDGLLRWLRSKFSGHVSYERIVSGPGLYNIYQYLREESFALESPLFQEGLRAGEDPGILINRLALEENDPLCRESWRLFVRVYGAEAGNWALKTLAHGGVLIGGGIAAKNIQSLANGDFMSGFLDKGRFSGWMSTLSVKVSLNQDAGLLGAAHYAACLTAGC